jgi:hypothetical protein
LLPSATDTTPVLVLILKPPLVGSLKIDQVTAGPLTSVEFASMPTRVSVAAPSSTALAVPSPSAGAAGLTLLTAIRTSRVVMPPAPSDAWTRTV